jgi:hypothetical protein
MRQILSCFLFIAFYVPSIAQKISGTVSDSEGKPIPFASIFIKGTTRGTNANNEGNYFLELSPGSYTLVCQHVNYKKEEKVIVCGNSDIVVNFRLSIQEVTLDPVIITSGEDPAYNVIRNTIRKRTYYQSQLNKFHCEVYTKGQLKVRNYPKRFLGRKIDFEDGDTSKQKMLFLSETISLYSVNKPQKERVEVISSKVSGQSDAYGLSAPQFFSFYENNVQIGTNLNPRGFISPISENALSFYKYKYDGEFIEDGRQVTRISVIPRRKYEPLFSGYINIVEDEWRIHSLQLILTKESQMEFIDTLRIDQLYRPVQGDVWAISSQVLYPSAKIFGFDAYGSFINIYSNFNLEATFDKDYFTSTVIKYQDSSNRKDASYWETARPIPLMEDEMYDYRRKDSLEIARKDPRYMDSLDRVRNKINLFGALLFEQTMVTESKKMSFSFRPLTEQFSFNPAEGFVINTGAIWTKSLDSNVSGKRRSISVAPNLRYGFANKHFNAHLTLIYSYGRRNLSSFSLSGGKRVFQFNNNSPIGPRGNTLSSLLSEENRMKTYEAWYVRGSYKKGIGNGFSWTAAFQYQDRMPLDNVTDYTWRDKKDRTYTPNYPSELVNENIRRHQVFFTLMGISWQPGARYIELPNQRINLGSKYPLFSLQYIRNYNKFLGSDGDFSKWRFTVNDDMNLKLFGKFRYRLGVGGFLDNDMVPLPDYQHFNGNLSTFATEYLNSFQLLPLYLYSNTSHFYSLAHIEHNFNGLITNKIPGIRKLNIYLVAGANGFYIDGTKNYFEVFAGIDNIFKQFRIDIVHGFIDGKSWKSAIRIGLRRSPRPRGDDWP